MHAIKPTPARPRCWRRAGVAGLLAVTSLVAFGLSACGEKAVPDTGVAPPTGRATGSVEPGPGTATAGTSVPPTAGTDDTSGTADTSTSVTAATTTQTSTLIPVPKAPFAVGNASLTFVDSTRGTEANNGAPATPTRVIPVSIYYPAIGAPDGAIRHNTTIVRGTFPLLVFAHGTSMTGERYESLLAEMARAGYVVAAPTLPITSSEAAGGANPNGYTNQPGDISFVITQMLAMSANPKHPMADRIDPTRVGVFGQSTGGDDAIAMTHECCRDSRVKAIASLDGSQWLRPGVPNFAIDGYFSGAPIPLLLIHGDRDEVTPYGDSTKAYQQAPSPKFRVTMLGSNHLAPSGASGPSKYFDLSVKVLVDFWAAYLVGEPGAVERLQSDANAPGVGKLDAAP